MCSCSSSEIENVMADPGPYGFLSRSGFSSSDVLELAGARSFSPKSAAIKPLKYSPAEGRHLGEANVSFIDGHAERLSYKELGYAIDPATNQPIEKANDDIGGPGNNRLWTGTAMDEPATP